MKNRRSLEIMVGAFVAVGLGALLVLAMQVSNLGRITQGSGYAVTAYFDNVGGLRVKAPVTLAGVRIGRVTQIGMDKKRLQAVVKMEIDSRYDYLSLDTIASIYTAGLLGEQYIALEPGAEEETLTNGGVIQHTQSAFVLEELIGKILVSLTSK